jgi:uncharacterized membrane protein
MGVKPHISACKEAKRMQKRMFWLIFITLGLVADIYLPLMWGLLATLPLVVLSWWIAYRSGWFE